jgi:hypothetical protein
MGESKGGRGGSEAFEPTRVLRQLADDYSAAGISVASISMQRVTEGVFAVSVQEHGAQEAETFFVRTGHDQSLKDQASPLRGKQP